MRKHFILVGFTLLCSAINAAPLPPFEQWQQKHFVEGTNFSIQGSSVEINADKSSAGLFLERDIDLTKTPVLNWSWKISNILRSQDEKGKKGDDFPARVYVVASSGPFPWQKKTICYVWSSYQKVGSRWANPYADNVIMLALNSGNKDVGNWINHSRNIQQDLETIFGKTFDELQVVAIMTDTDNSHQSARGQYRGLSFSAP
ncbi:MAG: DUF3047 domain-containing protein [Pseudomonadales bacterium]